MRQQLVEVRPVLTLLIGQRVPAVSIELYYKCTLSRHSPSLFSSKKLVLVIIPRHQRQMVQDCRILLLLKSLRTDGMPNA